MGLHIWCILFLYITLLRVRTVAKWDLPCSLHLLFWFHVSNYRNFWNNERWKSCINPYYGDPSWHKLLISQPGHVYWQNHFRFKGHWNGILIIDWFNIQVDCLLIWSIVNHYRLFFSFLWSDPDNKMVFIYNLLTWYGNTNATCDHIQQYVGSDIGHDIVPAAW